MADGNDTGSNLIWAVAMIIIVAIIAVALFYSGFLSGNKKTTTDIKVEVPGVTSNK